MGFVIGFDSQECDWYSPGHQKIRSEDTDCYVSRYVQSMREEVEECECSGGTTVDLGVRL